MRRITQQAIIEDIGPLEKVIADAKAHAGGYDPVEVRVYDDGTGEIRTPQGVVCEITFEQLGA